MVSWEVGVMIDDDDFDIGPGFTFRIVGQRLPPRGGRNFRCLSAAVTTVAEVPYLLFGCFC